ncbi:MAG: T9SS type A sorting domain-containing protein, partial [Bacteroidota bacterium]
AEVKFNLREPGEYTPAEAECTVPEETASFVLSSEIVYIIFEENPLAVEYFFEYRPVGGDWEEMEVEDGEVILFDLEAETTYEYVIYVEFIDGTFLESQVFTFTTIAEQLACGTPITSDYFVTTVDDDIYFAFISCNFVPDATMYRMRFRLAGTSDDWTVLEDEEPFFDIGFLEEGQEYEYQMSALCPNGWSDYTESFFFSTDEVTGTFTVQLGEVKFDLYPNPARDFVNVRINSMEAAQTEILISNLMGQTLYRQNARLSVGPNTLTLPTDRLGAGIYFVSLVQQNKGVSSQRLIIVD